MEKSRRNSTAISFFCSKMRLTALLLAAVLLVGCAGETPTETAPPTDAPQVEAPVTPPAEQKPQKPLKTDDPPMPTVWVANCDEYISLRRQPSGFSSVILTIPKNGKMELLRWVERYAYVSYKGYTGYVLANYIRPVDDTWYCTDQEEIVRPAYEYSYDRMLLDMAALEKKYPEAQMDTVGFSELNRWIPVLRIGSEDAQYHVLLQGAIHGREHTTAWLLMELAEYWLQNNILEYGDVCYHIIPMTNPDGVILSQNGSLGSKQQEIYQSDRKAGYAGRDVTEYATMWKANALGVDINRNFPAGWEKINKRKAPSSEMYQGEAPFSSAEARALRDYTLAYDFDATLSYHATGSVLYHHYGEDVLLNEQAKSLAQAVCDVSGYVLMGDSQVDGAGYKDWAMETLGIPSITVEIGSQDTVLQERELYSLFARNYRVLPQLARWLQQGA